MRVFINGFGRIGRSVLRAYLQTPDRWPGLELAGINDIAAPEMCAYLFEFDSVFGPWRGSVSLEDGALAVDARHLMALIRKAELQERLGDRAAAAVTWSGAIAVAPPALTSAPASSAASGAPSCVTLMIASPPYVGG